MLPISEFSTKDIRGHLQLTNSSQAYHSKGENGVDLTNFFVKLSVRGGMRKLKILPDALCSKPFTTFQRFQDNE